MSGLEERILILIKDLEEEKRLADKRAKQLYLAAGAFIGLGDTPATYAGQAGKFVKVNAIPDALVFANLAAGDLPAHSHTRANISNFWSTPFWGSIPDKPSTFPPSSHTHVKVDITDTPWAWTDVSKVGSNLTDLATRQHAGLTDVTENQHHNKLHSMTGDQHSAAGLTIGHVLRATGAATFAWAQLQHGDLGGVTSDLHHAQLHAASHADGQGDELSHDALKDFVGAEHLSLPNTIAAVLSDHNKAAHDALNIDADTVDGEEAAAIVTDARVKAHFPDTIANILSNHTLAVHNALNITQLGTVGTGVWQGTAIGWTYVSKTGSNLTDLATRQHAGLTNVTSDQHHPQSHTLASHSTKAHSELTGVTSDQHHPQSHTLASHSTKPHSALTDVTSDQHHPQSHELTGAYHTASGLTIGYVIKATGASSFEWGPLSHNQLTGVTSDQHHAKAHNILSADHPDSLVGAVARGDIIVGNVTPKWSKLGKGAVDTFLGSDGTDLAWMHVGWTMVQSKPSTFPPSAHTLASHSTKSHSELSDSPVNAHHNQLHSATHGPAGDDLLKLDDLGTPDDNIELNASTTRHGLLKKLTGSTTNFLRADGAWSAPTSSAHNLLSSVHTDTGPQACVRGDLIVGSDGPLWSRLPKGTSGQFLKMGAYDPVWSILSATDLPAHASRHQAGGADQVNHDNLTGFVAAEHLSLPNSMANVINSGHTKAIHDALNINADLLDGYHHASFMKLVGGAFTGLVTARDHGTGLTDEVVNVCYGTGNPPTASTTTIGTLFVKYTA